MEKINFKDKFMDYAKSHTIGLILIILITIIFTVFLSDQFLLSSVEYNAGEIAKYTVTAPQNIVFEDHKKTEEKRRQIIENIITIYDYDSRLGDHIARSVSSAFQKAADKIHQQRKRTPEFNSELKLTFEKEIGFKISQGAFSLLLDQGFSQEISEIIKTILLKIMKNGVVANKTLLMKEVDKGILLRDIYTGKELFVTKLRKYYGADQGKAMVRIIGDPLLKGTSYNMVNLIVDFAQRLIRPNITVNKSATQERLYESLENVEPVLRQISKGDIIIRQGEVVTPLTLSKLEAIEKENSSASSFINMVGKSLSVLLFILVIYVSFLKNFVESSTNSNKNLIFLTAVIIFNIILAKLISFIPSLEIGSYTIHDHAIKLFFPVASASMIVCLFLGPYQAYSIALICSFICSMIFGHNVLGLFIFFLINGVMATFWLKECKERQVFVKIGSKLALFNFITAPAFLIQIENVSFMDIGFGMISALFGGLLSGILAGGVAPLLEILFGYTSDIKLMELSNPEQPLLRQLMLEAPGTYSHSMVVGTMAEAAASEIGANSLLARVGGYYHDIGKLKKPLYFIENQRHCKNLHDKLSPSMSTLILTAHVKDGVTLAKEHKLPDVIIDIIKQHHGTGVIKYFYEKAKQKSGDQEVQVDHYRYPGPKPQTREAAIIMLADITEAVARSLDNPSISRIQGVVQKMINQSFSESQLDECNLTLKHLHQIAKSFNKILSGIHHHRIKYIEEEKERAKNNGNSDSKQEKTNQVKGDKPKGKDDSYLKRLGL